MSLNVFKLNNSSKPIFYALQAYYGVGRRTAGWFCKRFGLSFMLKTNEIPIDKIKGIYKVMDKYLTVEAERKSLIAIDIQNLMRIKSFRGVRLEKGLPVRGQRARTNGATQRRRPIKKLVDV